MSRADQLLLAFHVFGVLMWVGGLHSLLTMLYATDAEPDAPARGRLAGLAPQSAIVADIGGTLGIACGLAYLLRNDHLLSQPYMHIKLTLAAVVLGLHGFLRVRAKKTRAGEGKTPQWVRPLLTLVSLAIIVIVFLKVPGKS
jgi:putative membrane protein